MIAARDVGAFAEYTVASAAVAIHIPDSLSFVDAAQLGICHYTTCQVLYDSLSLPSPLEPTREPIDLLVWGGATSLGQVVVQYAALAGLRVISTASPKNFELVRSLGAAEVFDYHDKDVVAKVRAATGSKLVLAVDCISEYGTPEQVAPCLSDEGGKVAIVRTCDPVSEKVKHIFSFVFTLLGRVSHKIRISLLVPLADRTSRRRPGPWYFIPPLQTWS